MYTDSTSTDAGTRAAAGVLPQDVSSALWVFTLTEEEEEEEEVGG